MESQSILFGDPFEFVGNGASLRNSMRTYMAANRLSTRKVAAQLILPKANNGAARHLGIRRPTHSHLVRWLRGERRSDSLDQAVREFLSKVDQAA